MIFPYLDRIYILIDGAMKIFCIYTVCFLWKSNLSEAIGSVDIDLTIAAAAG